MRRVMGVVLVAIVSWSAAAWGAQSLRPLGAGQVTAAAYSDDGKLFALGGADALLFDAEKHVLLRHIAPGSGQVTAVAFSRDGKLLALEHVSDQPLSTDGTVYHELAVYSVSDGKQVNRWAGLGSDYNCRRRVAIDPTNKLLASDNDQGLKVFEIATGKVTWEFARDRKANPTGSYSAFDVTPDWKYFLYQLQRIEYPSKAAGPACAFTEKERFFWSQVISPDGKQAVASGDANGSVHRLFDLTTGAESRHIEGQVTEVIAPTAKFDRIFGTSGWWNVADGTKQGVAPLWGQMGLVVACRPDGTEVTGGERYYAPADIKREPAGELATPVLHQWASRPNRGWAWSDKPGRVVLCESGRGLRSLDLPGGRWVAEATLPPKPKDDPYNPQHSFGTFGQSRTPDGKWQVDRGGMVQDLSKPDAKREPLLTKEQTQAMGGRIAPYCLDNQRVVLLGLKKLVVCDLVKRAVASEFDIDAGGGDVDFATASPDGRWFVAIERGPNFQLYSTRWLSVYDLKEKKPALARQLVPTRNVWFTGRLAFTNDSKQMIFARNQDVAIYDTAAWAAPKLVALPAGMASFCFLSADQKMAMVGNSIGWQEIIDLGKAARVATLSADDRGAVMVDASGKVVASDGEAQGLTW